MRKQIQNIIFLTTVTGIAIHGINKSIDTSSIMKNLLKKDHGKFYNWKYGKIFYTVSGNGSPVLLIHDLNPASSSYEWEKTYKSLAKSHTVYTMDLLGCGRSDKPKITYTNYLYVQLMADFIKNVIGEKTSIITTGNSSSFGVMSCNMNPECYDKLILINPERMTQLTKIPSKQNIILKNLIDAPLFGTLIYNMIYSAKSIEKKFRMDYFYQESLISSKLMDTYYEAAHIGSSHGKYLLSSMKSYYTNINIAHALQTIPTKTYMIVGKENKSAQETVDSYRQYDPSIQIGIINSTTYLPQIERPQDFLEQVERFLND